MNRRKFFTNSVAGVLLSDLELRGRVFHSELSARLPMGSPRLAPGQPVDLAPYGYLQSWLSPAATPLLHAQPLTSPTATGAIKLATLPLDKGQIDLGVEWDESRTVNKVVLDCVAGSAVPLASTLVLEQWDGITGRQGGWKVVDDGTPVLMDGHSLVFSISPRRTCKVRVRLQNPALVEVAHLSVYGPSIWKSGQLRIEWGHGGPTRSYDGMLERYNGEVLQLWPVGATRLTGGLSWTSTAGNGQIAGVEANVLYASGADVDRSILTVRTPGCEMSFLPREVLEGDPIDAPEFGVYVRKSTLSLDRVSYRQQNAGKVRILDAVTQHPEQTLDEAYSAIMVPRVPLMFLGVDANNHKFCIEPDGGIKMFYCDPSHGAVVTGQYDVDTPVTEQPAPAQWFSPPVALHAGEQTLEAGWLPILITPFVGSALSCDRTDYAVLLHTPQPFVESKLMGNEPALLISRLQIRNHSTGPQIADYAILHGRAAKTTMNGTVATATTEQGMSVVLCSVDTQGRGTVAVSPESNAIHYSLLLNPGEEHTLYTVIPAEPLPVAEGLAALPHLRCAELHDATVQYWHARLAEGMQVTVPDERMQNLWNGSLQHWGLTLTKDGHRGEYYPNISIAWYPSTSVESGPIMQVLDMRGMHKRAEGCLQAWLSTQGDDALTPAYASLKGGLFFHSQGETGHGIILWSLAEHYLLTRDAEWMRMAAPHIIAACQFIIDACQRTKHLLSGGDKPLSYGLAPAGTIADPSDLEYSFMLNGYFYLGLKKSAQALRDVDPPQAKRIAAAADDYLRTILKALQESIIRSPVTRLRDNTSVRAVPPYLGLRGFSSDVKDSMDPDRRHTYVYDVTLGPLHLVKCEVLDPQSPEVTAMLSYLEDTFFMYCPLPLETVVDVGTIETDWFDLGGFEKLQPYYLHYQEAYLLRDQIPQFLRGFFNTLVASADPKTLTFREELDSHGGVPGKTHEEAWFLQQFRRMLLLEVDEDLRLAWGTPREWLQHGKRIAIQHAPSYFGTVSYDIHSAVNDGRIDAVVHPPTRNRPAQLHLRLRHPTGARLKRVTIDGHAWKEFDADKEWIRLPNTGTALKIVAYYRA